MEIASDLRSEAEVAEDSSNRAAMAANARCQTSKIVYAGCSMNVVLFEESLIEFVHLALALCRWCDAEDEGQDEVGLGSVIVLSVDGRSNIAGKLSVLCDVGIIGHDASGLGASALRARGGLRSACRETKR